MTRRRPAIQPSMSSRLLCWFDRHGRKDLPWQKNPTPYRVWVSEIMLQQTQVTTVVPYYLRFMQRFPDIATLVAAHLDEVLHLWTGLGYYARARNLHRAAATVYGQHGGELPRDITLLQQLPGIGRSTAAAILALAHGERHAILDGNVRRVLARLHAVEGWPGRREIEQHLWSLAESHLPTDRVRDYTQALMDLGATLCIRARPDCTRCPLADLCVARAQSEIAAYPTPKQRKRLPVRSATLLLLRNNAGDVLLEQRPPAGIWGGLWSLPECEHTHPADIKRWCREHLAYQITQLKLWPKLRHSFSHFHLDISPVLAQVNKIPAHAMEPRPTVWYNVHQPEARGLAAPVQRLLAKLSEHSKGPR
ncbi:MAG TPA: A/G-specific adenine glycosylase [Gammaproteobacteria bacterium]|nr:A/G-specific adenine glycosylase [Gammaproteobacteria bacterium]